MAAPKNLSAGQIINQLRRAEVALANGKRVKQVCRELGVSEQTYYRWRKEYGGMKVSQAKRLKALEKQNQRLKQAVADLTVVRWSYFVGQSGGDLKVDSDGFQSPRGPA